MGQDEVDYGNRIRLPGKFLAVEHRLARFDIPITVFVPEEAIECLSSLIEFVFFESCRDFPNRSVQFEEDPFIIRGEQLRIDLRLHFSSLHLPEAAGIPKFVAEVPAEFDILLIKKNVLAEWSAAHRAKSEGIRTVPRNQIEGIG